MRLLHILTLWALCVLLITQPLAGQAVSGDPLLKGQADIENAEVAATAAIDSSKLAADTIDFDRIIASGSIDETTTFTAADGILFEFTPTHTNTDSNFFTIDANQTDDADGTDDLDIFRIEIVSESGDVGDTLEGIVISQEAGTANTVVDAAIRIENLEDAANTMTAAIQIEAGTADGITTAIDVSDAEITTALSIGSNTIVHAGGTVTTTDLDIIDDGSIADNESNDLEAQDPANILDNETYVGTGAGAGTFIALNTNGAVAFDGTAFSNAGIGDLASSTSADLATTLSDEAGDGGGFTRANNATHVDPTINDLLTFTETAGDATCAAGDFWIKGNSSTNTLRGCENGSLFTLSTGTSPVSLATPEELTIATGAVTSTCAADNICAVDIDTEGAASQDDLTTYNCTAGSMHIIRANNAARTVTLQAHTGADFNLDDTADYAVYMCPAANTVELTSRANGA